MPLYVNNDGDIHSFLPPGSLLQTTFSRNLPLSGGKQEFGRDLCAYVQRVHTLLAQRGVFSPRVMEFLKVLYRGRGLSNRSMGVFASTYCRSPEGNGCSRRCLAAGTVDWLQSILENTSQRDCPLKVHQHSTKTNENNCRDHRLTLAGYTSKRRGAW